MKEIVIISGKGGTGKTSITASFAALAEGNAVIADCDVDAADLHLILDPQILRRGEFSGGYKARIRNDLCSGCGRCAQLCRFDAIRMVPGNDPSSGIKYSIEPVDCEGCGTCARFCRSGAIGFEEDISGEWYVSRTRFGTMVHARLGIAAGNSGKLVTLVRNEAKRAAMEQNVEYMLIDGSPGIGCPVIASITAADVALIVTEPTVSGAHDLRRIADLARRLGVPVVVCVNKWDINPAAAMEIRSFVKQSGLDFGGFLRYDKSFCEAQRAGKTVIEYRKGEIADDIRSVWGSVISRF